MSKYTINDKFFEKIDSSEKAYVLGFIAADGSINEKYNLIKIDQKTEHEDILFKIANALEYNNTIKHYYQRTRFKSTGKEYDAYVSRLAITNHKMVEDIKKYGIIQNKTDILTINFDLIPAQYLKDFFRGLFEGDGHYSICNEKTRKTPLFQIGLAMAKSLYDQTVEIFSKLFPGISIYGYPRHANNPNNISLIIANKEYVRKVLSWMYDNSTIYQDHKYERAQELLTRLTETQETIRKE